MDAIAVEQSGWQDAPRRCRPLRPAGRGLGGMSLGDKAPQATSSTEPQRPADLASDGARFATLIVAVAARADRQAFAALFDHFAPRVKSYMLRLGADPEAAEELAQETLLTVWRKAAAFDPARAAASTWIFTIARNRRIDALRRMRPDLPEDPVEAASAPERPDGLLVAVQDEARVRAALAALSEDQAEVVRQSFFADRPHSEIAEALGLPLGTVKSRLRLALARLRTLLGDR